MAKLDLRIGTMSSGKTTDLQQVAYNYEHDGVKISTIKPAIDTKGGDTIVSRIGICRKVDAMLKKEDSVFDILDLNDIEIILVDEGQFLTEKQIKELFLIAKSYDIPVIVYALKNNFKGEMFEGTKWLISLAEDITFYRGKCALCLQRSTFNARKENGQFVYEGQIVKIDGSSSTSEYVPLCGEHFMEKVFFLDKENQNEYPKAYQKMLGKYERKKNE